MLPLKSSSRWLRVGFGHHHFVETYWDPLGGSHPHWLDYLENCGPDDNEDKESLEQKYVVTYGYKVLRVLLTINSGLTGYFSSVLEVFTTFPLLVTFLAFFSLAFLICGVLGILTDMELLVLTEIQVLTDWAMRSQTCCNSGLLDGSCWNCQHNIICEQAAQHSPDIYLSLLQ